LPNALDSIDPTALRKALGSFATGVTIITGRGRDGAAIGLTVNSFNSVSLNPPLVLWSLANSAMSLSEFTSSEHWAVHVLTAEQTELSARFARRGVDKFEGVQIEQGIGGVPLLPGCMARFQCRTVSLYEGGDHVIFIGEVLAFDSSDNAPLVFHGGRYAHATRRDPTEPKPRSAHLAGSFSEDFLGYLLGRSHFRFFSQLRGHLDRAQLDDMEFYVLSTLTLRPRWGAAEIAEGMAGVLDERRQQALQALIRRRLARRDGPDDAYQLTDDGRELALSLIAAAKGVESQVLERLGSADAAVLKALLNRLLHVVDGPAAELLWASDHHPEQ